ncbi:hypothetical protein ACROYT_G044670 [Oculina patagonica]
MDEPSIVEPPATEEESAAFQLDFQIVEDSTKRGKNKLVDNRGYIYNIKRHRGGRAATKASSIVNEVLHVLQELTDGACPGLPKAVNLIKADNHLQQCLRPTDPVDLEFELQTEHIQDDFLRKDIKVLGRRHLMFASTKQLKVLCHAKSWYIDGTFKLCLQSFNQLLTINAFVRSDKFTKQDCSFHWTQALWRKEQLLNKPKGTEHQTPSFTNVLSLKEEGTIAE